MPLFFIFFLKTKMRAIIIDLGKKLAEHLAYEAGLIIQIQNANATFEEAEFLEEYMCK